MQRHPPTPYGVIFDQVLNKVLTIMRTSRS
jgi:hypothetical protein